MAPQKGQHRNKFSNQCGLSFGDAGIGGQVGEPLRLKKLVFGRIAEMDGGDVWGSWVRRDYKLL